MEMDSMGVRACSKILHQGQQMNSKSKVKITAREILDLVSMKKLQLHEAVAVLRQAKKELRKEAS